jgi:hypothetical protein
MKTMMELLIRLQQLRRCCERTANNKQLTDGERKTMHCFKSLVRDSLPKDVLAHYDQLEETKPELRGCPEVLAMAVLADTWRDLSPAERSRLETHFATSPRGRQTDMGAKGRLVPGQLSARSTTMRVRSRGKSLRS